MKRVVLAIMIVGIGIAACKAGSGRDAWTAVIKPCATKDLLTPNVLLFGPTDAVGPGTIMAPIAPSAIMVPGAVDYETRWGLETYDKGDRSSVVIKGSPAPCASTKEARITASGQALLSDIVPSLSSLSVGLFNAATATASAASITWDSLDEAAYARIISSLPADDPDRIDLAAKNLVVVSRALRVTGFTADVTYDPAIAKDLKTSFPTVSLPNHSISGNIVNINGTWTSDTTLHLVASEDFYIGGELRRIELDGSSSQGSVVLKELVRNVSDSDVFVVWH